MYINSDESDKLHYFELADKNQNGLLDLTEIKSFTSGIALQWLHLQALLQSTFGLVSALVFSVRNFLGPAMIWLILFSFFFRYMSTI